MLFNSFQFLIFLPLVAWLHARAAVRYWNALLLAASLYFYAAWNIYNLPLLLAATLSAYAGGMMIMRVSTAARRKGWLALVVALNIGLLAVFKYYHFIAGNVAYVGDLIGLPLRLPDATILLPMGISFFTFQAVGYVVDPYRGQIAPGAGLRQLVERLEHEGFIVVDDIRVAITSISGISIILMPMAPRFSPGGCWPVWKTSACWLRRDIRHGVMRQSIPHKTR